MSYRKYKQFIEDFTQRLKKGLSDELTYHGYHHVMDVMEAARKIGSHENLSENEWELLNSAIVLHDSGFLYGYTEHEERGCLIAAEILPEYNYSDEDIAIIQGMIRATKIPQQPKNLLEQIIADADLEYLGTDRFDQISETLFQEWQNKNIMSDRDIYNRTQVKFISAHHYFTDFCVHHRQAFKMENLERVKQLIVEE
ncbi:MAG: phosphohydrolase [Bacteroidetes bacterium]|nr:phosphohydrolase [Bacteroidota bacterium]